MKKHLHYIFVLDRSGSMSTLRKQTFESLNEQITTIKMESLKEGVETFFSLLLFDTGGFDYLYKNYPASKIDPIGWDDFIPRGGTPLRDAVGKGVVDILQDLKDAINDEHRNVLVTIFTDGEENSSREFSHEEIQRMIKQLSEDGKFVFTFVGAGGIDQVNGYASSIGIDVSNVVAYSNDEAGNAEAFEKLKTGTTAYMANYSAGKDVTKGFFNKEEDPVPA